MQSNALVPNHFAIQSGLHVAIIMDGNGRWAERCGLPRMAGHRAGAAAARRVVEHALDLGIKSLTLYAFSSDNWRRPAFEVQSIFWLLRGYLRLERERLRKNGTKLQVIGRRDRLPKALLREIEEVEAATAPGSRIHVRVAVDYSSAGGHRAGRAWNALRARYGSAILSGPSRTIHCGKLSRYRRCRSGDSDGR